MGRLHSSKQTQNGEGVVWSRQTCTSYHSLQLGKNCDKFTERHSFLKPWLGCGLASADEKWFRNRRLITPAFHYETLRGYVPIINSCLKVLIDKWMASSEQMHVVRDLNKLTTDILMQCAFSSKTNCQDLTTDHPYINAVNDLILLIDKRMNNPLNFIDFIYYRSADGKHFDHACRIAHKHTGAVVGEKKKALG